jgi:type II secretory pathway component PulK
MRLRLPSGAPSGSVLIIVLWIAFGLVALALYFADSMNFELRASQNRVATQASDQAIEGAARYINYILSNQITNGSNGCIPGPDTYVHEAVPVGEAHFWLIGRDSNNISGPTKLCFGLVDEASKLNLNTVSSNALSWLPRMTEDLTQAILDWRDTNGNGPTATYYAMEQPSYVCKGADFETVDELRLLYGADMDILVGNDINRNGILDPDENNDQDNQSDPGIIEFLTPYTREPNTNSDGSALINITDLAAGSAQLQGLLQTNFGDSRASQIMSSLGLSSGAGSGRGAGGGGGGGAGGGGGRSMAGGQSARAGAAATTTRFNGLVDFYIKSSMTMTEFAQVWTNLTATNGPYIEGRVNVNTASYTVLTCLLNGDTSGAQQLVNYRQNNPANLTSVAWVVDALQQSDPTALTNLEAGDFITAQTFQFTADIAALGPHGRGYRRVRFVFDTSSGVPQIVYRQDLTHLGWALGKETREHWLLAKGTE